MRAFHRRAVLAAAVTMALGAASLVGSSPASAGTIDVEYQCLTNFEGTDFDRDFTSQSMTITAPTVVDAGDPIPVIVAMDAVPIGVPFGIQDADVLTTAGVIVRPQGGGPDTLASGTPQLLESNRDITPYETYNGSYNLAIPTTGIAIGVRLQLVPDTFTISVSGGSSIANPPFTTSTPLADIITTCTPQSTSDYAARTGIFGPAPTSPVDRCVAQSPLDPLPVGCDTEQVLEVSVTAGSLTQRAFTNSTPTVGSVDGTGGGLTSNVNSSATQINMGTIETPVAPSAILGRMNDITVTDNRGSTFGWTLSASLTDSDGIASTADMTSDVLAVSPSCTPATPANAWDYSAAGQVAIPGFDPTFVAPGANAGPSGQTFDNVVALCTKDLSENSITGSTGGVYTVEGALTLTVPAFQAADTYTATMTITLA